MNYDRGPQFTNLIPGTNIALTQYGWPFLGHAENTGLLSPPRVPDASPNQGLGGGVPQSNSSGPYDTLPQHAHESQNPLSDR